MGQGMSCTSYNNNNNHENVILSATQLGDLHTLKLVFEDDPTFLFRSFLYDRQSLLHIAAAHGQIDVLCWLLDRSVNVDGLNRYKQTPLMVAAMHGKISCVDKLLHAGANILMFDSVRRRTCLHFAAYNGHSECVNAILSAARTSHVAISWGFARFVNIRDGKGATPLHLAASQGRPDCVHALLDCGALLCASTGGYGHPGSTPLHLAARGGCLDCIRELLAWGADRLQRDGSGRIPYVVAVKYKHGSCAALLNPSSAEPLVWPSPLKFISELNPEAKVLLERALMEVNREREKTILKGLDCSIESPLHSDVAAVDDSMSEASDVELCCICFDQVCTIEVQDCGHKMCAHCTLALCCHNKPNPTTAIINPPVCPFCRSNIARLVVANLVSDDVQDIDTSSSKVRKSKLSWNLSEGGSSSFKGISSAFGKMTGRGSGRVSVDELIDKPND
ncbi:putative E3 ubiquitin-protein ligase XBAT31 [Silene latifolia]|uniref:putative E3 ubiquitin-protein ligase XBAT31 n=1 Tax=Silene latifolia TaxID=37657 RepID=UPI003D77BEC5